MYGLYEMLSIAAQPKKNKGGEIVTQISTLAIKVYNTYKTTIQNPRRDVYIICFILSNIFFKGKLLYNILKIKPKHQQPYIQM